MRQSILQYLEQPSLLSEVALDELVQLAERFPYSTNVRLLVLLKARNVNSPDYDEYLNRFAASTFDRAHLYHLVTVLESREEDRGEVLELLELEELELEPISAPAYDEPLPSRMNELSHPDGPDPAETLPQMAPDEPADPPAAAGGGGTSPSWLASAVAYWSLLPRVVSSRRPVDPIAFAELLGHRRPGQPLVERLRDLRRRTAVPRAATSSAPPQKNGDGVVVSETLAALLVRQGQYQSAIRMYHRLSLLYPDKKAIFAGLIKELKEKL